MKSAQLQCCAIGLRLSLFFGLNLLIRPEDEKYIPVWSQEEILKLKEIMNMGIDFFDCQFQENQIDTPFFN